MTEKGEKIKTATSVAVFLYLRLQHEMIKLKKHLRINIMSKKIDNLILEHLKLFQGSLNRLQKELSEVKSRLTNLKIGQGEILSMVRHQNSLIAQ